MIAIFLPVRGKGTQPSIISWPIHTLSRCTVYPSWGKVSWQLQSRSCVVQITSVSWLNLCLWSNILTFSFGIANHPIANLGHLGLASQYIGHAKLRARYLSGSDCYLIGPWLYWARPIPKGLLLRIVVWKICHRFFLGRQTSVYPDCIQQRLGRVFDSSGDCEHLGVVQQARVRSPVR